MGGMKATYRTGEQQAFDYQIIGFKPLIMKHYAIRVFKQRELLFAVNYPISITPLVIKLKSFLFVE